MKFLHTADLHLGKQLNDLSMLADQGYILDQIISIAETQQVDAVLIAGDVYQRSSPQSEAMALFDRFVSTLVADGRKVFAISGNHDSQQRISYFSELIRGAGAYVSQQFDGAPQQITLTDEYGPLTVHLLPFLKPYMVRRCFPDASLSSYQEAMDTVLAAAPVDTARRNVLLCHQFVTGAEPGGSEELSLGGLDNIGAATFADFDYVALGHIHRGQRLTRDTLRYAGSPLKYALSEADHHKSVTIVTLREKGDTVVETVPLYPLHDVRRVEGLLAELLLLPYSEDYVWATIHDDLVPPDAAGTLSTVFPNLMRLTVVNARTTGDLDVAPHDSLENKSVLELFSDFYRMQNNDVPPDETRMKVLTRVLRELEEDAHEAD